MIELTWLMIDTLIYFVVAVQKLSIDSIGNPHVNYSFRMLLDLDYLMSWLIL